MILLYQNIWFKKCFLKKVAKISFFVIDSDDNDLE